MEDAFKKVVEHIFNNWTALKLVVDHAVAGSDSKKVAEDFMNYIVQYCLYESDVDVNSIQEALEDVMDQEFETLCEDGSTTEIAVILYKFLQLIKTGNLMLLEEEYNKLPTCNEWLVKSESQIETFKNDVQNYEESGEIANNAKDRSQIPMEEVSEWTEVKSRRKR